MPFHCLHPLRYKNVIKGTPKTITLIPKANLTMLKDLMMDSWPVWHSSSSYPEINHTYVRKSPYYLRVRESVR